MPDGIVLRIKHAAELGHHCSSCLAFFDVPSGNAGGINMNKLIQTKYSNKDSRIEPSSTVALD